MGGGLVATLGDWFASLTDWLGEVVDNPWAQVVLGTGLLGLVAGWMHKRTRAAVLRHARNARRALTRRRLPLDLIGQVSPNSVVIDAELATGYAPEQIVTRVVAYEPPPALAAAFDAFHRDVEAQRRANLDHTHNGHQVGLHSFTIRMDEHERQKTITLELKRIRYDEARCQRERLTTPLISRGAKRLTLLEAYVSEDLAVRVPSALPCPFGIGVLIETSDRRLIVTQRASRLAVAPGKLSSSVGEGMLFEKHDADGRIVQDTIDGRFDLRATFERALGEELGVGEEGLRRLGRAGQDVRELFPLTLLAFIATRTTVEYNFVGYCRAKLTEAEIRTLHAFHAHDPDGRELVFWRRARDLRRDIEERPGEYASRVPMLIALAHRENLA